MTNYSLILVRHFKTTRLSKLIFNMVSLTTTVDAKHKKQWRSSSSYGNIFDLNVCMSMRRTRQVASMRGKMRQEFRTKLLYR